MTSIAFTGHRPKDLPRDFGMSQVAESLDNHLNDIVDRFAAGIHDDPWFITGGALGIDTWAAEYAISRHLPLALVLPFDIPTMTKFWSDYQRERLMAHRDYADKTLSFTIIHEGGYDVTAYDKRNHHMVDTSDILIAFWSGKPQGGTANCIRYAAKKGHPIVNLYSGEPRLLSKRAPVEPGTTIPTFLNHQTQFDF